ncbi:MAG: hypothetical protein NTW48_08785 [Chloroflexi bacterium]|nr:hypothetical protein [Chloroflexota bacterium]
MPAKASGVLTLDTAPFIQSLEAAKIALKGFAVAVGAIALTAVAGFAVLGVGLYKIISSFKDGLVAAFQFGKEMNSAARQIQGVGVGNFFLIQKALEKSGMSAEEARSSMKQMSETGMSWDKLWKTPKDAATAIAAAKEDFGPMATALDKGAKAVSALKNIIDSLSLKFATFFQAFLAGIVEPLKVMLKAIEGAIDLSKLGTKLGDKLGMVMTQWIGGIADGNIGAVLGAQLKLAWIDLTKELDKFFKEAGTSTGEMKGKLGQVFSDAGALIGLLLMGAFTQGSRLIGDTLANSWRLFAKVMNEAAPKIFGKSGEYNKSINDVETAERSRKAQEAVVRFNISRAGSSEAYVNGEDYARDAKRTAELDADVKLKKGVRNIYAGEQDKNTPSQQKAAEAFIAGKPKDGVDEKASARAKADEVYNEALKKASAKLIASGEAVGGVVGKVAAQVGGFAKSLAGTEAAARKTLADAEVSGIIAGELYKKENPEPEAPPLGQVKPMEIIAGSLAKIGGSGGVFQLGQDIVTQNATQTKVNTANTVGLLKQNNVYLKQIAGKTSSAAGVVGP